MILSSEAINFRNTMIKLYQVEDENKTKNSNLEFEDDFSSLTRSIWIKRLSLRYQNVANIIFFLQNDQSIFKTLTFVESRRKEINDLLKKRVFELITVDKVLENVRIFNSRYVDEIKHSETSRTYEKFWLVI
jgi:hypothetical protein